jgi:hypothetical protein
MGGGFVFNGSNRGFKVMFDSCNIAQFRVTASADTASAARTVVFKGNPGLGIVAVTGTTGAPRVTFAGPAGERLDTPAQLPFKDAKFAAGEYPSEATTYVIIRDPGKGPWTLTPDPGSAPIKTVRVGQSLPPPTVHATVVHAGGKYELRYSARLSADERVSFLERGPHVSQSLGTARGTHGTLAFRPQEGPAGSREIVAMVDRGGTPSTQLVVAHYRAPGPIAPGRPGRLRFARTRRGVLVRWGRARNATGYVVTTHFHSGRSARFTTEGTSAFIDDVNPYDSGRITVMATRPLRNGPSEAAHLPGARIPKLHHLRLRRL